LPLEFGTFRPDRTGCRHGVPGLEEAERSVMEDNTEQRGIVPAFAVSRRHDNHPPAPPASPRRALVRRALERFVDVDLLFMILVIGLPLLAYCILMAG
jgi:hypothetical protein